MQLGRTFQRLSVVPWLAGLILCLASWFLPSPALAERPVRQAVVVVDGATLSSPSGASGPRQVALAGDLVNILGPGDRPRTLRVVVDKSEGVILRLALVELAEPAADARILVAAFACEQPGLAPDQPDDLAAAALYARLIQSLPKSNYLPLALYRFGQVADRLAIQATREAEQAIEKEEACGLVEKGIRSDEQMLQNRVLAEYEKRGVTFAYSHLGGQYYYAGDAYRRLVERYPASQWADNAAFALLRRGEHVGGWEGWPTGPLKELGVWREFIAKYPKSELLPEAHLQVIYLNRALYEIYSFPQNDFKDAKKAAQHRQTAEAECKAVLTKYSGTVAAAQAAKHLAELTEGVHIYIHGAGWSE